MKNDLTSDNKLSEVFPDLADRWRRVRDEMWDQFELQIKVTQGFRTFTQQWELYCKGRIKGASGQWVISDQKKIVTYARAGESFHNFGLAIDSAFIGNDPFLDRIDLKQSTNIWATYGRLCQKNGLVWGGSWKIPDRPHCENSYGLTLGQLRSIFEERGISGVFAKLNGSAFVSRKGGNV